ncbi:MAG: peptide chain release factor 2 [Candidatus Kerfeldbacteria bacterium]|nr:peptide chain release factor 2 [Candidatus Kerfeldbacteria bacterium]
MCKKQNLFATSASSKGRSRRPGGGYDPGRLKNELAVLEIELSSPDLWTNQSRAREVSTRHGALKDELEEWESLRRAVADTLELAQADQDDQGVSLRLELEQAYQKLLKRLEGLEFRKLLADKYDEANALVAFHAGAGGTDAQDWTEMLRRMILRFCDRQGFQVEVLDESRGQEAGLKSSLLKVTGRWAYGYLKCEAGVHRLVRLSPFDAAKMRHTSFALVEVLPELPEVDEVELDDKDLRIDTFLSRGHGGQSVNTTYSAVRVVHLPTGITVSCQNERSQTQNKAQALKYLQAKLWQLEWGKQQVEKQKLRGEFKSAAWGNQARSYVLHPYKLVKDHRTGLETQDPEALLEGDLKPFIEARLKQLAVNSKQ